MPPARALLWLANVAALGLAARSVLIGPLETWVTLAALAAYLIVVVSGWLYPSLEMYADLFSASADEPTRVGLALMTKAEDRPRDVLLDSLDEYAATATFFVSDELVNTQPDAIVQIAARGHELGLRTPHLGLAAVWTSAHSIARSIAAAQGAVQRAAGVRPRLLLIANGGVGPRLGRAAQLANVLLVRGAVRLADRAARAQGAHLRNELRPGMVLLIAGSAEADRVRATLAVLREQDLRAVSVAQLAAKSGWLDDE